MKVHDVCSVPCCQGYVATDDHGITPRLEAFSELTCCDAYFALAHDESIDWMLTGVYLPHCLLQFLDDDFPHGTFRSV